MILCLVFMYVIAIFHFYSTNKKIISRFTPILFLPISSLVKLSNKTAVSSDASVITASCGTCREFQTYHTESEAVTKDHVKMLPLCWHQNHTQQPGFLLVFSMGKLYFNQRY